MRSRSELISSQEIVSLVTQERNVSYRRDRNGFSSHLLSDGRMRHCRKALACSAVKFVALR
jgi:hypothetical protein